MLLLSAVFLLLQPLPSLSELPLSPQLPFWLSGGDQLPRITLNEPFCLFVDAAKKLNVSAISLRVRDQNGALGAKTVFSEFLKAANFDHFGFRCFPATTLLFDYGDAFANVTLSSVEFNSLILFFMPQTGDKGPCRGRGSMGEGNVHKLNDAQFEATPVSLHADCPAYFLLPTGIDYTFWRTSCPRFHIAVPGREYDPVAQPPIEPPLQIDVSAVPNWRGAPKNRAFLSFTSDELPRFYGVSAIRNVVVVTSNASEWSENVFRVETDNAEWNVDGWVLQGDDYCKLERTFDYETRLPAFDGLVATDPLGPEQVTEDCEFPDEFNDPFVSFEVEVDPPDVRSCINVTLLLQLGVEELNLTHFEVPSPLDSFNVSASSLQRFFLFISRNVSECPLVDVRFRYSAVDDRSKVTTSTTVASTTTTMSSSIPTTPTATTRASTSASETAASTHEIATSRSTTPQKGGAASVR